MRAVRSWLLEICVALVVFCAFGLSFFAFAQIETPVSPRFPVPTKVIEVKDGDTIAADILLPWDVTLRGQDLRESSYDAWESSKRRHSAAVNGEISDAEVAKGKLAASALKFLLESGDVFVEPEQTEKAFGDRDVYGRVLGKLWVKRSGSAGKPDGWLDVGKEMTRRGHVRK